MKSIWIIIVCVIAGFVCCQKESNNYYQSDGKIVGADLRACICCGGWQIQIDSMTYNFDSLPVNSTINLQKESFPILVNLDWQIRQPGCPGWIKILRIRKK